jgi:hypothetical protein
MIYEIIKNKINLNNSMIAINLLIIVKKNPILINTRIGV